MRKELIDILKELAEDVAIVELYRPICSISSHQDDLIGNLVKACKDGDLEILFGDKKIETKFLETEILEDWQLFNEWIADNDITGYFAVIHIPVRRYSSLNHYQMSYSICYLDMIYYETEKELIEKLILAVKKWDKLDIEQYDLSKAKQP